MSDLATSISTATRHPTDVHSLMRRPSQRRLADTFLWIGLLLLLFGIADLVLNSSSDDSGGMSTATHRPPNTNSKNASTRQQSLQLDQQQQRHLRTVQPLKRLQQRQRRQRRQRHQNNVNSKASKVGIVSTGGNVDDDDPIAAINSHADTIRPYSSSSLQSGDSDGDFDRDGDHDALDTPNNIAASESSGDDGEANSFDNPVRADMVISCQHTKSNPHLVTDSRGYICPHTLLQQVKGCCSTTYTATTTTLNNKHHTELHHILERYACEACDQHQCCESYEQCVSCCLAPKHSRTRAAIQTHAGFRHYAIHTDFDICAAACRSGSNSVVHENAYKHLRHHCFGLSPPAIDPLLHRGVFDFATPVSNHNSQSVQQQQQQQQEQHQHYHH